ncbi:hypothetical protein NQ318_005241 [Aromia moschata]|uniref:Uncharacterized protein n=1 Tax=Aromia moschata TaxID=1265417 RepID=A0AAV8XTZ3_9CUCU|nr:hypothetical protein NQ318_005241 [Aromia moschata]
MADRQQPHFAVVHYFTKYGSGECYFSTDFNSDSSSDDDEWASIETKEILHPTPTISGLNASPYPNGRDSQFIEVIPLSACSIPMPQRKPSQSWSGFSCISRSEDQSSFISPKRNLSAHRLSCQNHQQHRKKKKRSPGLIRSPRSTALPE